MFNRRDWLGRSVLRVPPALSIMIWLAWQTLMAAPAAGQPEAEAAKPANSQPARQSGQPKPGPKSSEKKESGKKESGKKEGDEKKDGDGKGEQKGPAAVPSVRRSDRPSEPPNPDELKVRPDEHGRLQFHFVGQPWPDLLEWLAEVSNSSLDWQEMPGDYLNLTTNRTYTVAETRDLFNRHLMARGFTLLRNGEVLTVVKLDRLNPSMVPRVAPEDLDSRDSHEFVKVSFSLDWLLAETAVEELKPMLSTHGKLFKLGATNRIEAIDAVVNLREIHRLLKEEQSATGQERLVKEFKLDHTRANEVLEQLETLLGIEKKPATPVPMTPQQMQQMRQMQQRAQQGKPPGGQASSKKEGKVHLVVNQRENSILAHAPPDKMAIVEQAIRTLDVPSSRGQALLQNIQRMQIYRLASLDPDPLVKMLNEIGNLDPVTRLEVDKKNRSIVAYATLADHLTIRQLVEKLDGSDRRFEVIRLRRLKADYVAGTIEFMMGGDEEDNSQNRRYSPFYYYSSYRQRDTEEPASKFRVDADVEHNRLLLWANEIELQEVENLLIKLGEIPARGSRDTLRVLDIAPGTETEEILERVRKIWPSLGPNELLVDPSVNEQPAPRQPRQSDQETNTSGEDKPPLAPDVFLKDAAMNTGGQPQETVEVATADKRFVSLARLSARTEKTRDENFSAADPHRTDDERLASLQEQPHQSPEKTGEKTVQGPQSRQRELLAAEQPTRAEQAGPPPVRIMRSPDGGLVITSEDPNALGRLEDLITDLTPPRKGYKIFQLKYPTTWAYGVALNLEEFFQEGEDDDGGRSDFYSWYWGSPSNNNNTNDRTTLSQRRPLKFIADSDTNTILVQGADPQQLAIIQDLIDLYDRPPSTDSKAIRRTKIFRVHYSRASVIARAIKDIYRDLLSPTDRALMNGQQPQQQKQGTTVERSYTYVYGGGNNDQPEPESPIRFKGLLSVGVDDLSNSLVVSATEGLLENIGEMIKSLDDAARREDVVRVVKINSGTDATALAESLKELLDRKRTAVNVTEQPVQNRNGEAPPQQRGVPGGSDH